MRVREGRDLDRSGPRVVSAVGGEKHTLCEGKAGPAPLARDQPRIRGNHAQPRGTEVPGLKGEEPDHRRLPANMLWSGN